MGLSIMIKLLWRSLRLRICSSSSVEARSTMMSRERDAEGSCRKVGVAKLTRWKWDGRREIVILRIVIIHSVFSRIVVSAYALAT
jgi:hypothetical protein